MTRLTHAVAVGSILTGMALGCLALFAFSAVPRLLCWRSQAAFDAAWTSAERRCDRFLDRVSR